MDSSFSITRIIFFFIILIPKLIEPVSCDLGTNALLHTCNSTDSTSGTVLALNFVIAMANLSTMVNRDGFGMVNLGAGPGRGYAIVQCFNDLNLTDCSLCFSQLRSIIPKCFPKIGGRVFFDGCIGRYENYNFFHEYVGSSDKTICSSRGNSSRPMDFLHALNVTLGRIQSSAPSNGGFYVYTHKHSNNITVSALGQCWRNLDKESCSACLLAAASSIVSCSPALEGRSLYAGCYLRYSDKIFWDPQQIPGSSGVRKIVWISMASVFGGILLFTAVLIWFLEKKWHRLGNPFLKELRGMEFLSSAAFSNLNFKYNALKKATNNFNLSNKIGQGSYGTVYKGVLRDGREVAVKRLFLNTRQWVAQFFNEVDLISQFHHKNLVKLLGCSLDGPESLLVYEYYYNKSLDFFIFDDDEGKLLDWKRRVNIIQGIAEGLCHLHEESEVRVVHRDIKASNILLDDYFGPKITDFGLAKSFTEDQTHMSTGVAGTLGYMAPEYIMHGHLTEKADVFSFGVLLLEIVTGQKCSGDVGVVSGESLLFKVWKEFMRNKEEGAGKRRAEIMDERIVEDGDEEEFWRMVHVGLLCTQIGPGNRPRMSNVVAFIRRISGGEDREDKEEVPTEPPFLDVLIEGDDKVSCSISSTSGPMVPYSGPMIPDSGPMIPYSGPMIPDSGPILPDSGPILSNSGSANFIHGR